MHRSTYSTDAGMHCVWDQSAFSSVSDYDSWERELLEDKDIERQIRAGSFVPLNIGSDGLMDIEIRVGTATSPAELNARETQYLIVRSEPYLLRSQGAICASGIEQVCVPLEDGIEAIPLPAGDYGVTVHLIAWDEEPGMQTDDGPAEGALPDYVVLINPPDSSKAFRSELKTFS